MSRVVILGAGVVGTASAYYLAQAGVEVTVIEREPEAGMVTSFANGGLITPSMSDPWASPGMPMKLLRWFGREGSPFLVRPGAVPGLLSWGLKFMRQCNAADWRRNTETTLRLCIYSHDCLKAVVAETGIAFDLNPRGTLHLFRDELSIESTLHAAEILGELGVRSRRLDAGECVALEPAFAGQQDRIAGGLYYPDDDAGDAHIFTQALAEQATALGATFRYGETVRRIAAEGGAVTAVETDRGRIETTTCLVALGNGSAALVRPLGIRLPIYPVKGYSLTYPVGGWNGAPTVPFVDDARKMGVVRLGDRIRVAGTAEFTGHDLTLTAKRIANLRALFSGLFPDYPDPEAGEAWTGLRPTTPDGLPYLGPTPVRGLYLNTGHGHLGWTMACGSGRVVADLIQATTPEIEIAGLTLDTR